jgi:DNA replication protein DnaC
MNKAGQLAERLLRHDVVILDELGYLPFSSQGGVLLFHLLSKLYEQTASSLPPISASANGRTFLAMPR